MGLELVASGGERVQGLEDGREPRRGVRPARVARVAAAIVVAAGATMLARWVLDVRWLHAALAADIEMEAGVAAGLVVLGLSLLVILTAGRRATWRFAGPVGGTAVALLALSALAEYVLSAHLGVADALHLGASPAQSSAGLVLAGTAVTILGTRHRQARAVEILGLALMVVSFLAIAGSVYGAVEIGRLEGGMPMGRTTAIAFVLLAVAMLAAADGRLVAAVTGPAAGSVAARRLLPLFLVGIPVLALLTRAGENGGVYDHDDALALLLIAQVVLGAIAILSMTRLLNRVDAERDEALDRLEHLVRQRTAELNLSRKETLERLAFAAEYRDDDTYHHTERVGHVSALLARELGMDDQEIMLLRQAAPLHDVGKLAVPDAILLKPGKLTADEFDTMKDHTVIGARILKGSSADVLQMAERIALYHHERYDGRGYPMGLRGDEIPLPGRIVAVADVFDALTHERPYKPAWPHEEAVAEIRAGSGSQFDRGVVKAFEALERTGALEVLETNGGPTETDRVEHSVLRAAAKGLPRDRASVDSRGLGRPRPWNTRR
jgi:putative nucleotidyltransferase with HDIG domain